MRYFSPREIVKRVSLSGLAVALVLGLLGVGLSLDVGVAFSQAQGFKVGWVLPTQPNEGRVGLRITLANLELTNQGTQPWPKSGNSQLRLAYRWFTADNSKPLDPKNKDNGYEELRADLPQDIPTGGRVLYPQFLVSAPTAPGDYWLHVDLVQGTDGWLSGKDSPDLNFKVTIKPKDVTPPTTKMTTLPIYTNSTSFTVNWEGSDEENGSGLASFDVQYKIAGDADWHDWLLGTSVTSARFQAENGKLYLFRSRAIDRAGNLGKYPDNEQASTRVDSLPPSAKVEALPTISPSTFLVRWSSYDNLSGAAGALCDVQYREGSSGSWTDWQLGSSVGAALFRGEAGKTYAFRARAVDYAGNQGDYPNDAQSSTSISAPLNNLFSPAATEPISGTTAITNTPQSAIFPLAVKSGENSAGTTTIMVYNPGQDPLNVFVRFNDRAGAPITTTVNNQPHTVTPDEATALARVETVLKTVPPGGTINVWAGVVTPANYNGWVEVRASGAFQASEVRLPAVGAGLAVQYAPATPATQLYLPYVKKSDPLSSSFINLANPNPTATEFTITYYDAGSGNALATDKRTLPRYGSTRIPASGIATADPNVRFSGTAVISSSMALAATVETSLEDGTALTYPALITASQVAPQLPIYRQVDGVTTSLLVQNVVKDAAVVKIEYLNSNGEVVATREQSVPGFGRLTAWQGDVQELSDGFTGKVRVSTNSPNSALAVTVVGAGPGMQGRPFIP
jgi:hypothetical protein